MGNAFKNIFQFTVFCVLMGGIAWFVAFEVDPYNVCVDHPSVAKRKTYFVCKPLGIEVKKPAPERKFRDGKF